MRLELAPYSVRDIRLGPRTVLQDGVLEIDARELRACEKIPSPSHEKDRLLTGLRVRESHGHEHR